VLLSRSWNTRLFGKQIASAPRVLVLSYSWTFNVPPRCGDTKKRREESGEKRGKYSGKSFVLPRDAMNPLSEREPDSRVSRQLRREHESRSATVVRLPGLPPLGNRTASRGTDGALPSSFLLSLAIVASLFGTRPGVSLVIDSLPDRILIDPD